MGLRIQNNVEAFNAHRNLSATASKAAKAMEKLSSGYRVNRAADDAAGLAISEKMRGQIGGLAQAQRNAQDAISLVQTGEGALNEVHSMLQRIRDLKVQYSNGTLEAGDKLAISSEVQQLGKEISDITSRTEFNGIKLLTTGTVTFQVGAESADTILLTKTEMSAAIGTAGTGGLAELIDVGSACTVAAADTAFAGLTLDNVDEAIKNVSNARPRSARSRTASSTASTTSRPTRRTWWRPSPGSATWTWPRRWSTSRSSGSCSRPARACSRRPTRRRRASCPCSRASTTQSSSATGGPSGRPFAFPGSLLKP